MRTKFTLSSISLIFIFLAGCHTEQKINNEHIANYVEISKQEPSYFQLTDGSTYIPIGINMINPSGKYNNQPDSAFYEIDQWMKNLSENGGTGQTHAGPQSLELPDVQRPLPEGVPPPCPRFFC